MSGWGGWGGAIGPHGRPRSPPVDISPSRNLRPFPTVPEPGRRGALRPPLVQNLAFARALSDRVYIIDKGVLRFSGTFKELEENPEVKRAHLMV